MKKIILTLAALTAALAASAQEWVQVGSTENTSTWRLTVEPNTTYSFETPHYFNAVGVFADQTASFAGAELHIDGSHFHLHEDPDGETPATERGLMRSRLITSGVKLKELSLHSGALSGAVEVVLVNPGKTPIIPALDAAAARTAADFCTQPTWISQDEWAAGLSMPSDYVFPAATNAEFLFIHHSAGSNNPTNFVDVVRAIFIFHTQTNGWNDVGYNFLIAQDGTIFAGRRPCPPEGHPLYNPNCTQEQDNIRGAHASPYNTNSMAACFLGNYEQPVLVPAEQIESVVHLFTWKARKSNIDVLTTGFHAPTSTTVNRLNGHRDVNATSCPGTRLYYELPWVRSSIDYYVQGCETGFGDALPPERHPFGEPSITQADSLALLQLFDETGGANGWVNTALWKADDAWKWFGVETRSLNVTRLDLAGNNLRGALPEAIGTLPNLAVADFSNNELADIPTFTQPDLELNVANNRLGFDDIEPNLSKFTSPTQYAPQKALGQARTQRFCAGSTVELTTDAGSSPSNSYQWYKDGQMIANETSATLSIASADVAAEGSYYCVITNSEVADLTLTQSTVSLQLTEAADPSGTVIVSATANEVCLDQDAVIAVASESQVEYDLLLNGSPYTTGIGNGGSLLFTVKSEDLQAGANDISVEASRGVGCTVVPLQDTETVTVFETPAAPTIQIANGEDGTLCQGETLTLEVSQSYDYYRWNTGSNAATLEVSSPGTYSLRVGNSSACQSEVSNGIAVSVIPASVPTVFVIGNGTALQVEPGNAYQWFLNGDAIEGATASVFVPTESGDYTVALTNSQGCTNLSVPITFEMPVSTLSLEGVAGYRLFPNPSRGVIHLQAEAAFADARLVVTNLQGQEVMRQELAPQGEQQTLSVEHQLEAGTYLISIETRQGTFSGRLVVES